MKRASDGTFKENKHHRSSPPVKPVPPVMFTEQQVLHMMRVLAQTLENRSIDNRPRVETKARKNRTCPSYIT